MFKRFIKGVFDPNWAFERLDDFQTLDGVFLNTLDQAPVMFQSFITPLLAPCGLHMILANHRYLWKMTYDVINKRGQDELISAALKKIGAGYLAFQLESYFKR